MSTDVLSAFVTLYAMDFVNLVRRCRLTLSNER